MTQRRRNWLIVAAIIVGGWLIHPFFVRNMEAVMERYGWDRLFVGAIERAPGLGRAMSEYLQGLVSGSGFWAGALAIVAVWGVFESVYAGLRKYRRSKGAPLVPLGGAMGASVLFIPDTGKLLDAYNISSIVENGTGDFTINFDEPFSAFYFRVVPIRGSKMPDHVSVDGPAARAGSVRIKYNTEPERIDLMFYG